MPDNHSNTRIKKLSPLLINQLAAGEVVTRPAAVVKELLENAIDAGATNIEIRITQGGMGMIEVVDNGVGIHPDDMVMAITRHATSKVADVANLHGITTLGFRGEALAAMAAVSRLSLTSTHDDNGIGRQLQVAGVLDDTPKLTPVVHNRGTTIIVKDLYFNVPARRGNLKSMATEFGHIETIVREVALARSDIALTLFHDNKKRLSLTASASSIDNNDASHLPLARLEQATGMALMDNVLKISIDLSNIMQQPINHDNDSLLDQASISGWLWPMTDEQKDLPKLIYVNGRLVKEALISNQMRQLAQSAYLAGMGYALYFELPAQWLNINVHPSKQRIKISPLNNIMAHLSHTIRSQLKTVNATPNATSPGNPEVSKKDVPVDTVDNLSDTHVSNELPTDHTRQSMQVQAPRQSYQSTSSKSFPDKSLAQKSSQFHVDELFSQRSSTSHYSSKKPTTSSLPTCLDVITCLDNIAINASTHSNTDDTNLPWLLFYNQGQCLLISAKEWQSKMSRLFESRVLSNHTSKKSQQPSTAFGINQQLTTVSLQMTAQDSAVFVTDLAELLTKNAIKVLDRDRLVTLMLSSKSDHVLS